MSSVNMRIESEELRRTGEYMIEANANLGVVRKGSLRKDAAAPVEERPPRSLVP
jgi:hypothetical protein